MALTVATMAAALVFVADGPAQAHAILVRSDPPANRLAAQAPPAIVLEFSEPVDPIWTEIRVLTQEGAPVGSEAPRFGPDRRTARLPVQLPGPGIYTVVWRTFSTVDLHTYEGFFTFTLGPLRPGSFAQRPGVPGTPSFHEIVARWLMFLAGAVFAGGAIVHCFVLVSLRATGTELSGEWARGLRRRWRAAAWLAALTFGGGAVWEFAALGVRAAGTSGSAWFPVAAQLAAAEPTRTALGMKLAIPLVLILTHHAGMMPLRPSPFSVSSAIRGNTLSALQITLPWLLLLGISLTGHAAASGSLGPLLGDWLHLISAGSWVGGLFYLAGVLAPALRRLHDDERTRLHGPVVQRFSTLALASVILLVATGGYAAWVNIPSVEAVGGTTYGRTLIVKIGLLIPLLGIAAVNLLVMRPRLAAAAKRALDAAGRVVQGRFWILVRAEVALASLVLLAAAVLAVLPTARQAEALALQRAPLLLRQADTGLDGLLRTLPYRVGENTFDLRLRDRDNLPVADVDVELTFLPLIGSAPETTTSTEAQGDGSFVASGGFIDAKGPWLLTATVRREGRTTRLLYPLEPGWERGTAVMPPSDPRAAAMLAKADAAMNRLRTLRQRQEIADGSGNDVVTFFELAAPGRMHYRVVGGLEVIMLGSKQFVREDGSWRPQASPVSFTFPNFTFSEAASNVVFGPRDVVDGRPAQVVTFVLNLAGSQARYAVWIDLDTFRILREFMVARSHYMIIRNYDFDAPLTIRTP